MKTVCLKASLSILFITACITLYAQRYDSLLKKIDSQYPQEKLYLHFDRSVYLPGETIWFKAYLMEGNLPSIISKTLYTELTDAKGKVLQRVTAPFIKSGAAGSFDIPANISGQIFVRAYTKWMLNFDPSFLYTKTITIISPQKTASKLPPSSFVKTNSVPITISPVLQFFPEGGDLVQGLASKVAFKATDEYGMPVSVTGEVFNNKGKKITSFSSVHDGMGAFILKPETGEQYKAVWKDQQGQTHESSLPSAKQTGVVLGVTNFLKHIDFKITRSETAPAYSYVYVVAQMNQQPVYMAKVNLVNKPATGIIPIENVSAGIMQITVFAPGEQPLAERIVFANSSGYAFITDLTSSLTDIGKRKKNIIEIDVPDTVAGNLSVSITDSDLDPAGAEDNIYSHFLLTEDLKGYVHDPAYYFSSDADSVASHLELVMMTNGWRRFKWENLLAGNFPKINYMPENYISIEGQVHGLNKTLLPGKEVSGMLELKNKNTQFLNIPVQPDGHFSISGLVFYDTARFFYQFNNDKKKKLTSKASFEIMSNLLKAPPDLQLHNFLLLSHTQTDTTFLLKNTDTFQQQLSVPEIQKIKTLKTVVVTTRQKSKQEIMDAEYTSGLFSGGVAHTFLPEEDSFFLSSKNVFSFLRGKIAGLEIGIRMQITWRGYQTIVFINERQEEDLTYIMAIRMNEIAMIKVFNPPFYGATGGGPGGAIAIYLKKGAIANEHFKGLNYTMVPGYSPVKEFYSPDYSKSDKTDVSDYRATLYWNPFVITDKNHRRISLSFYNNDITKKIKVIIEGFNDDGKLTRVEKILQ